MNTSDRPESQSDYLDGLSKITRDIVENSSDGDYIYRGEPEHYEEKPYFGKVSSTLYRGGPEAFDSRRFNLIRTQEETVREARIHIHEYEKKDFEILTELQHFGEKTNLIDFTTDYHIALFFACDGSHDKNGRVILLKRTEEINKKYQIEKPEIPQNRVLAQKSIFAQPPKGFIDIKDINIVSIPSNFKQWILIHLRKFQDISTQSIYNDLHGFIRHSNLRSSEKALFPIVFADIIVEDMADASLTPEERNQQFQKAIDYYTEGIQYDPYDIANYVKQGQWYAKIDEFDRAIETFSKAIFLKPDYAYAYHSRGWAYFGKGDNDSAIKDFTKLTGLNRCNPEPYFYRGMAYYAKEEYDLARKDFGKVRELKPDYLADLKQKSGINPPEDIAAMLTPEETDVGRQKAQNTAPPVEPDVEIAIKKIKKRYHRAWKTLAKF